MDIFGVRTSRKYRESGRSLDLYLKEIGETSILERPQERILARQVKLGNQWALDRLVKANLRFVVSVARQYQNQGLSLEDLINEGNVGLVRAAKRFDESRGFKFISYAVWWIRQAILQALAEQSRIVRLPLNRVGVLHKIGKVAARLEQRLGREPTPNEIAGEMELSDKEVSGTMSISNGHLSLDAPFSTSEDNSLIDVLEDESSPPPDAELERNSLRLEIEKALETLTPREAEVISLYFGLGRDKALTLEEIGIRFCLTRERIRQIKEKAIRRLRHASRSKSLRAYLQ